jgi:hypothetical protein
VLGDEVETPLASLPAYLRGSDEGIAMCIPGISRWGWGRALLGCAGLSGLARNVATSRRTLPTRRCLPSVAALTLERGLPLAVGGAGRSANRHSHPLLCIPGSFPIGAR